MKRKFINHSRILPPIIISIILISGLHSKIFTQPKCDWIFMVSVDTYNLCNNNPWVLVFEDDFNGDELDLTKWKLPYQGVMRDNSFKDAKQWLANTGTTPSISIDHNIQVNNGALKIITKKENPQIKGTFVIDWGTEPPTTKTSYFKYSSGEIESRWNFSYGKIEARIKIPKGKGFWPAFWTFAGYPWNELDIFEFWNENDIFHKYDPSKLSKVHHMTSHYDYDNDGNESLCGTHYTGVDFSQDFHIFTLIWQPDKIEWYVDGILKRTDYRFYTVHQEVGICIINAWIEYEKALIYPIDPMSIILGMGTQYGNDSYGNNREPDATTPFPSPMEIDWVRYYQRNSCANVNITDASQFPLYDNLFNVMIGTNVEINCNYNIQSNQYLKILSEQNIILKPGFSSQHGSEFHAIIQPSICTEMFANDLSELKAIKMFNTKENNDNQISNEIETNNYVILIYPNPSSGIFKIDFGSNDYYNYRIEISNLFGKTIQMMDHISVPVFNIDMTDYSKGLYFVHLTNKKTSKTSISKMIIK